MIPEPKRAHRSDWWATFAGQEHAIGHERWTDWKTLTYRDEDPGGAVDTPRAVKVIELLRKTGVLIIQRNGPNMAFNGWCGAYEISDLEVRGAGFWYQCKLKKRIG